MKIKLQLKRTPDSAPEYYYTNLFVVTEWERLERRTQGVKGVVRQANIWVKYTEKITTGTLKGLVMVGAKTQWLGVDDLQHWERKLRQVKGQ